MLIKKIYGDQNLTLLNVYSNGKLRTAFPVYPDLFITCECEFWSAPNGKVVLKVRVDNKETMSGGIEINRNLTMNERLELRRAIEACFYGLPLLGNKLIRIYE